MNLIKMFDQGQAGGNKGLNMGFQPLTMATNGIQKAAIYGIAGAPKSGKSTLVDYSFLLSPYVQSLKDPDIDVQFIYFSYEIDRVRKEFRLIPYFFSKFYNIDSFEHKGKLYRISSNYLMGKLLDKDGAIIMLKEEHKPILMEIYETYIIPLFGEYNILGKRIKKGKMSFIDKRENPSGINKRLELYAESVGKFEYEEFKVKENGLTKIKKHKIGYIPNNPRKHTIVILDHIRKLRDERGFEERQLINKMLEYQVDLRNLCGFTFVDIVHLNRSISEVDRMKYAKEYIYPTGDDVKGSGNLSEEADFLITLFNPLDEKYNLKKHFDVDLDAYKNVNYRSIHLVESRDTECPVHFSSIMDAESNIFKRI